LAAGLFVGRGLGSEKRHRFPAAIMRIIEACPALARRG
jgi:hypothetical protein